MKGSTARMERALSVPWNIRLVAKFVVLVLGLSILSPVMRSQGRFEVQPYVGFKWGGSTGVAPNITGVNKISLDSSVAYGVSATFNATPHFGVEFLWNRQPTQAAANLVTGGFLRPKTSVTVDQLYGDMLFSPLGGHETKLQPFILVGFGGSIIAGKGSSITKFAYALGGGVKYFFSEHLGARLQIRYAPTYLYSTSGGIWCTWYGFCYSVPNDHYLNQGDITGGLIVRF